MLINKLTTAYIYLRSRFLTNNSATYDALNNVHGIDLDTLFSESEVLRVRLYIQRTRYAFKSIFLLYWYVAFCYLEFVNHYQIAFWLILILGIDLNILRITSRYDDKHHVLDEAKALENRVNVWEYISALAWSAGG